MKRFRIHIILILCLLLFYAIIAGDSLLKRFSAGPGEEGIVQEQGTEDNNDTVEGEQPQADLEDPQDESDDPLSELEEPEEEQEPRGTSSLKISVVGDIMVHNHQLKAAREPDGTYNFTEVFEDIRPYLEEADIVMGNLETTISTDEKGYTAYPRFRSPISLITAERGGI